jgi:tetratricopeptide (TPR) repeat protein
VTHSPLPPAFGDSLRRELLETFVARRDRSPGTGRGIPGLVNSAGMISAAQGDSSGIREAIDSLATLGVLPIAVRLPDMRNGLEAQIAWIGNNPQRVVDLLANAVEVVSDHRFLLARALEALGRYDEALNWYRSYPDLSLNSPAQLGLVPASLLRIAEIHDRRGEQREARAAREKFVRMWRNADPELQPIVEAARAKIAGRSG